MPQPDYKLLIIQDLPHTSERAQQFSTYQWPGLLRHLRQMLIADAPMEEGPSPPCYDSSFQVYLLLLFVIIVCYYKRHKLFLVFVISNVSTCREMYPENVQANL